jgi:hypothetical protein
VRRVWRADRGVSYPLIPRRPGPGRRREPPDAHAEARRFAELGEQVTGQDRPDAIDRLQRQTAPIAAREASQLGLQRAQLILDRLDQSQQTIDLRACCRRQRQRRDPAATLGRQQPRALARPPSCVSSACSRCAQRVRSSANALRNLVWSRSVWISAGGSHDSGSIPFANNTHSQRASSRSVFARLIRPRSAFACAGSIRRTSNPRAQLPPHPAPAVRCLDRDGRQPSLQRHRPVIELLPRRTKTTLDRLATVDVQHGGVERALVNIDRCVQHRLGASLLLGTWARDRNAVRGGPSHDFQSYALHEMT